MNVLGYLEASIAEMATPAHRTRLRYGIYSGFAIAIGFGVLAAAAAALDITPWRWAFAWLVGLKLLTNTLAWLGLARERGVLGTQGLNTLADVVLLTAAIYFTGGPYSPLLPTYVIIVAVLSLLSNLGVTLLMAGVIVLAFAAMLTLMTTGVLPPTSVPGAPGEIPSVGYAVISIAYCALVVGVPAWFSSATLRLLRRKEVDLQKRTDEAIAAAAQRSQFVASMTHELRTPIHGVQGLADVIAAGVYGPVTDKQKEACASIKRSGARSSKIKGINIADACAMQIDELAEWARGLKEPSVAPLLSTLRQSLESFVEIGLGYLSLDRPSGTLSGGEAQRTKMVRHLGSSLTDVTYVFDEPTIGLHPHDIQKMNELLLRLRDKGNTVLVVEHKPETIAIADHVVDLGPGAGAAGGTIVFEGTVDKLRTSPTLTGRHFSDRAALKTSVRTPKGSIKIRGAKTHNLKHVNVDIPLGVLVVITGVAGSGKSSLIHGSVVNQPVSVQWIGGGVGDRANSTPHVIAVDQAPIKGSRRSNPATYTDLLEPIRKAFAKANNVKPALFSANSEGACETCNGNGVIYTDLGMMAGVTSTCEDCQGKRFQASVLEHKFGTLDIAEVFDLSVDDALGFFGPGKTHVAAAHEILLRMKDVGVGYLRLGQPLTTLSGGERQRLKLAASLVGDGGIYVLDEPTTGLHLADLAQLLGMLDRLVDAGKSVIVIEHHQAVMAHADWIIDLGPGAGHDGGKVVFEGTPARLVATKSTLTGKHLAAFVKKEKR